jgi:hypothetical protein
LEHSGHCESHGNTGIDPEFPGYVGPFHQPGQGRCNGDAEGSRAGGVDDGVVEHFVSVGVPPDLFVIFEAEVGKRDIRRQFGQGKTAEYQEYERRHHGSAHG